jgi:hypothetical protein
MASISTILQTSAVLVNFKNLVSGETKGIFINPEELETEATAKYKAMNILGMGNVPSVYENTEIQTWEFSLYLNANLFQNKGKITRKQATDAIQDYNSFLLSLVFPVQTSFKGWIGGEPPKVFFSWPNVLSAPCRVESVKWTLKMFDIGGAVSHEMAKIKLRVDNKYLYYSEDVRFLGWQTT